MDLIISIIAFCIFRYFFPRKKNCLERAVEYQEKKALDAKKIASDANNFA